MAGSSPPVRTPPPTPHFFFKMLVQIKLHAVNSILFFLLGFNNNNLPRWWNVQTSDCRMLVYYFAGFTRLRWTKLCFGFRLASPGCFFIHCKIKYFSIFMLCVLTKCLGYLILLLLWWLFPKSQALASFMSFLHRLWTTFRAGESMEDIILPNVNSDFWRS